MSERLARITSDGILPLTVFAEHNDMVAFQYERGGYGWARRDSFVDEKEARRIFAERKELRERAKIDANLASQLRIQREIVAAQRNLDQLTALLAHYEQEATHA